MKTKIKILTGLLLTLSLNSFAQVSSICLDNPDDYYFSLRNISSEDNFDISDARTQVELKEALTNQIVSEIQIISSSNLSFTRNGGEFSETEVFNSFSQSTSNAILFNPMFKLCSDSGYAIVYIEKKNFDNLAINYFKSLVRKINSDLNIYNRRLNANPDYEFKNEILELLRGLTTLDSYFGLMNSLDVEDSVINNYLDLDVKVNTFLSSVNSLDNNIIEVESLISNKEFTKAYDLLSSLDIRYPRENRLKPLFKNYNDFVRLAKKNKIKELKTISSSNNYLSLSLGYNTSFVLSNTQSSGSQQKLDEGSDRFHPNLHLSYLFNNRNRTAAWGLYSKYHISTTQTFDNEYSDYTYPFSDSFLEAGVLGQWYAFSNINSENYLDQDESAMAISIHLGRYLNNFTSSTGEKLNFYSITPGFEWYFNNKVSKTRRTSIYLRYSFVGSNSIYNYNTGSLGLTINFKSLRKLSEQEKEEIDNDFKLIN